MSKNKRDFITGLIGSGIIFFIGVLYVVLPNYYGVDNLVDIKVNNLFISFILVYATVNISLFYVLGKNPNNETLWICISTCLVGMLNVVVSFIFKPYIALRVSIFALTVAIVICKMITAGYYKSKKDATYYFEYLLIIVYTIVGLIMPFTLINNTIVESIELGFYIILISIIDGMSTTFKALLKAPRFLGKIKF